MVGVCVVNRGGGVCDEWWWCVHGWCGVCGEWWWCVVNGGGVSGMVVVCGEW